MSNGRLKTKLPEWHFELEDGEDCYYNHEIHPDLPVSAFVSYWDKEVDDDTNEEMDDVWVYYIQDCDNTVREGKVKGKNNGQQAMDECEAALKEYLLEKVNSFTEAASKL